MDDWITLSAALGACDINSDTATDTEITSLLKAIDEDPRLYVGRIDGGVLVPETGTPEEITIAITDSIQDRGWQLMRYFAAEVEE
ncbi:hypothetical protein [Corynebacterium oculi]|uniref:hypothetical protein n=1 Tax=Corynebacterium oculi TaxID=1544416 RepID=UPI0006D8C5C5|nr:hypothetical protein [Corynebacterium oculi]